MKWILASFFLWLIPGQVFAQDRILYVTHEPGRWHEYSPQLSSFRALAVEANWKLTVATGTMDETVEFLKQENFARDQDAIVYNFCMADSRDIAAMSNLISQTADHGVPALLIHCSMHSWWDTFKKGKPIPGNSAGQARADRRLIEQWQQTHSDQPLPAWGDFTGVASTGHGRQKPIALTRLVDHPVTARLPEGYSTVATELYNNHYIGANVKPLLQGKQGRDEAIVMWLAARGGSEIIGLTLGHGEEEWNDPVFRALVVDALAYLASP
ncbi:MAG: ThuA domain-containing protein [Halioglobus sp.]